MNMKDSLRIVVTGASAGLGEQLTNVLREYGHTVYEYDIKKGLNVCRPSEQFVDSVDEIDVLINCAGVNSNQWFEDIDEEDFMELMEVNAFSIVKMTQAFLPKLIDSKGTVINIVSNAAHIPMTSSLSYNASKAAALMITRQMAHELTPKHGITVFSVSPNKLEGTEMSKQIEANVLATRGWTPEFAKEYQRKALMHGLETPPEAVAEVIAHLLTSGASQFMSGCDIPVGK